MDATTMDIPFEVKKQLAQIAEKLPTGGREKFLKRVCGRLADTVCEAPCTMTWAIIGAAAGEIADQLLTIHVPFLGDWCLSGEILSHVGFAVGGLLGWKKDAERRRLEEESKRKVAQIIREETVRAKGDSAPTT